MSASYQKNCPPRGSVGFRTPPCESDRVRSMGWCQFSKNDRLVGRLGSGPHLVADKVDVVFTHALVYLLAVILSCRFGFRTDAQNGVKTANVCSEVSRTLARVARKEPRRAKSVSG